MATKRLNGHIIELSHQDKLYFPDDGITKGEVIDYYHKISPLFLRSIRGRPLTLQRFPEGIQGESFYQKDASDYFPEWICTKRIKKKAGGNVDYIIGDTAASVIYLVNQGCITFHTWLSTVEKTNYPNCVIWDLDPPHHVPVNFPLIVKTALRLRMLLENLGLSAWVMTTGSRGIHVRVPIKQEFTFNKVRLCARSIAQILVEENPDQLTIEARKEKRGSRLLIDVMRNSFGATAVAPYSLRALPHAPVATPITWETLRQRGMHSQKYTMNTIRDYLVEQGDVWKLINKSARSLKPVFDNLRRKR